MNALVNRSLVLSVACHKAMFFSENDATGTGIDYETAVSGGLQLVPAGTAHAVLPMACYSMTPNRSRH